MSAALLPNVHVSRHPLVAHKVSILRKKETSSKDVRALVHEIASLLMYEATAHMPMTSSGWHEGTLGKFEGSKIADHIAFVPVLRAGLGLLDAALEMIPSARVHHLGIYREKSTLQPVEYYNKLPAEPNVTRCVILDVMIATGGTARAAVDVIRDWGVDVISFVCICASDKVLLEFAKAYPTVRFYVGVVDEGMDDKGNVYPGIGDAGDRLFHV